MKRYILIIVLITATENISGNLLNHTKVDVATTQRTENVTLVDLKKEKHSVLKNSSAVEQHVYLEDVFYRLKSLNWSDDQEPCLSQTLWMLSSLKNFSLWAVWEWDSISSEPIGLLYGNHYQLGNFDECMLPPWGSTHPELSTQYCLAKIKLETNGHTKKHKTDQYDPYSSTLDYLQYHPKFGRPKNELTWGVCVPASCSQASVERLMVILLSRSHLGNTGMTSKVNVTDPCQRSQQQVNYDAPLYGFWVTVVLFVIAILICTYVNGRNGNDPRSIGSEVIQAFSLKENAKGLLKLKSNGSEILYGIRFFSMVFIVFDHNIGIFNMGPVSDGVYFDKLAHSVLAMFVLHGDLMVDSYFFLSGFLVMNALMSFKKLPNPIGLIIKRYMRLTVGFAVVIFFTCAVFPYTGSGPLWPSIVAGETDPCRKNWWLSLLMLNNYVDSENICLVVSWYIPCDFHFFVITVVLYVLYQKMPTVSKALGVLITLATLLSPGILNYIYKLPAIQLFTYDFLANARASRQFHLTYIKSHARMTTYIMGLAAGYIFTKNVHKNNLNCISKKWSIIGTLFGLSLMLTIMTVGTQFLNFSYTQLEGSIFAVVDRPLWTIGLAILVLCCCLGDVPYLKSFLSWYPWVPLSRLTYGLYLAHSVIIARNTFIARNPLHNDTFIVMNSAMGTIVLGSIVSLVIFLLFEAPINNTIIVFMRPRLVISKSGNQQQKQASAPTPSTPSDVSRNLETSGHLQGNLPTVIQYTSKV